MKAIFHSIEELDGLRLNLQQGYNLSNFLHEFVRLCHSGSTKSAYSMSHLNSLVSQARPGDIILVVGNTFYGVSLDGWDIYNRAQLANALRAAPEKLGLVAPQGTSISIISNLFDLPYLVGDAKNGNLVRYNKIAISLITDEDFTL